jgi:hypothetical protein
VSDLEVRVVVLSVEERYKKGFSVGVKEVVGVSIEGTRSYIMVFCGSARHVPQ